MELKTGLFCRIARESPWQEWLGIHSKELLAELVYTIEKHGCGDVELCMVKIVNVLKDMGLEAQLSAFLMRRYPYILKSFKAEPQKHEVFAFYNPNVITFPSKLVMRNDDPKKLVGMVEKFTKDKCGVDFVIVDDCAYIEYFNTKHRNIANSMPMASREVHQYKQARKSA